MGGMERTTAKDPADDARRRSRVEVACHTASLVGVVTIVFGWLRWRDPRHVLRNNLATYAAFPLVSSLFFHAVIDVTHTNPHALSYYLAVLATFVLALGLNFVGIVGFHCYL